MKKSIAVLLLVLCCFVFSACAEELGDIDLVEGDTHKFQFIGEEEINHNGSSSAADVVQYYVDNDTMIVYMVILDRAGNGTWAGFTPLVDADGSYVTYDEFNRGK